MATGDPNEALRAYVNARSKPAPAPNPNDALRAYVSTRKKPDPNEALASFVSTRRQTPPVQHQQPSQFIGGLQQSRQRAEEDQAKRDALASKASVLLRGVPVFGNELANLISPDPVIRELRGTEVLSRASQAGGGAINEWTGQPHLEAQASDLLGPSTRHGAQQQGQSLTDLAAVPPTSTGFEDLYGQELNRAGRAGGGGVSPEQAQAIAEHARAVQAAEASQQEGRYRAGGFVDAENMGPRAVSLAMGASPATPVQRPAKRPVQAQDISNLLAAEQADAEQSATDRFISGSRTPLPFAYEAAREAGMSPLAGGAAEVAFDPLTWLDLAGKPAVAGVQAGRRFLGDLAEVGGDVARGFERGVAEHGTELTRPAAGFADPQGLQKIRTAREIAEAQTAGPSRAVAPEPTLPTAQDAARRRISLIEQQNSQAAALRARQAEIAAQERLAELAPGEKPSLVLPERAAPQPLEVVSNGPRAVRETISPARDAEIAQQVAEGQAREAEILAKREAELAAQPTSSTLEVPGQPQAPAGRIVLPGEEAAGPAARIEVPGQPSAPPARLIVPGQEQADPNTALREFINGKRGGDTPAPPARRIPLPEQAPPVVKQAAEAVDPEDYINRRAFGEVAESPVYNDLQRVQREMADLERERMRVERQGQGQLSREARTANMKQSDALRADAERLQARHDQLRQVAAQDAATFRQAYRRGEAAIPGPTSLEQGYAPQRGPASLEAAPPAPGRAASPPPNSTYPPGALVPQPAAQPPRRQSLIQALTARVTGKKPNGQVRSKVELIREMAATLDKMEGVKTVYGMGKSANRKTPARFLSKIKLIEIKRGNLTGFLHELGHSFDERQAGNFSRRAELNSELDQLGAQGHSSWQPGMGDLRRRQEGVAEFARLTFEDPELAAKQYPKMHAAFEQHLDEMGDLGAEWRMHQNAVQIHMKSPGAARASAQITDRPDELWRFGKISNTIAAIVDRYSPLRALDDVVEAFKGVALKPSERMYIQSRMLKGQSQVKVKEFQDALKEVLKPINDMGAVASKNFSDFVTARHAIEMEEAGLNTGVAKADWEDLVTTFDSPEFRQAADDLYAWQRSINDYAIEQGNLNPLKVEEWYAKWKYYVPTNREMENVVGWVEPKGFQGGGSKGLKASAGPAAWLKRKRGGHQRIYSPIETMLQNLTHIVNSTERNRVGKMLAEAWDNESEGLGAHIYELKSTDLAGKQYVTVRDGRPDQDTFRTRYFGFTDKELYKAYAAMDEKQLGGFVRFLSLPAGLLRWGATKISLPFVLNNLQRDTVGSALNSRVGSLPIAQSLDGLFTVIRAHLGDAQAKELVEAFHKSGGLQGLDEMYGNPSSARKAYHDVFSSLSRTEQALTYVPQEFRPAVRALVKAPGFLLGGRVNVGNVKGVPVAPFSVLESLSNLSEQATRMGEFKNARKFYGEQNPNWSAKDVDQMAGFEAMDLLDFDLRGNNEAVRIMRSIIPFSGSSVTGLYRNLQAARENPRRFAALSFGFLAAPTLALYALNRNNPYYWELTQQDRDAHWHIPIPAPLAKQMGIDNPAEQFFRFKKPFLMGTLGGASVERMAQYGFEKDPRAFEGLMTAIASQSTPATVDDLGGPLYKMLQELNGNVDLFRDRPIEAEYQRKGPGQLPSYLRSDEYSSITARMISKALHDSPLREHLKFSPLQIDHLIRGMTGGGGESIVKGKLFGNVPGLNRLGIDPALSALTGQEEAKASRKQFLGQVPSEGRHESEDRFFERLGRLRETVNDPANPDSKKMAGTLNRYESTEKLLKGYYKQRAQAKDETQRMRLNRLIVRETERLEPPTGRQKELRQRQ